MLDLSLTLLKMNFKTSHSILNQKLQKKSMEYSNPLDYRHRPSRSFQYLVTTATDFDRSDDREVVTKEYTLQSSDNRCRDAAIINLFYVVVTDLGSLGEIVLEKARCLNTKRRAPRCAKNRSFVHCVCLR